MQRPSSHRRSSDDVNESGRDRRFGDSFHALLKDWRTFAAYIETLLSTLLLLTHSGELYTQSCKDLTIEFPTILTGSFVFLLSRLSALVWHRWLYHPIVEAAFTIFCGLLNLSASMYMAVDLDIFKKLRQSLKLCHQFTNLSEPMTWLRISIALILGILLIADGSLSILRG